MTAWADGFLPLHIEIRATRGTTDAVKAALKPLQAELRAGRLRGDSESLLLAIARTPDVTRVWIEGAQSSLLIPLRMIHGLTGMPACMAGVIGTGPIADAITADLARWHITGALERRDDFDSPLELSIRDDGGASTSLKLYPGRRAHYRHRISPPEPIPQLLFANRVNQGLTDLSRAVRANDGRVSLRLRPIGRYGTPSAVREAITLADQICVSARGGALRDMARLFELTVPRGWPREPDDLWTELARRIATHGDSRRLVALMPEGRPSALFDVGQGEPRWCTLDATYDPASRMARLQGACAATPGLPKPDALPELGHRWLERAFGGTEERPWHYPIFADPGAG